MKPFRRRWSYFSRNLFWGSSVSGAISLLCSVAVYLSLILLPQGLWLLSNGWGLGSGHGSLQCEACSLLPAGTMSHYGQSEGAGMTAADTHTNLTFLYERLCQGVCELWENGGKEWKVGEGDGEGRWEEVEGMGGWGSELFLQWLDKSKLDGGWSVPHALPDLTGPCTIQKRNSSLSLEEFLQQFDSEPVVLVGVSDQTVFRTQSSKWRLLQHYGQEMITAATANTHSYHKVQMTLCDYVGRFMRPQSLDALGNETLYHFGDNDRERWDGLFSLYQLPPYPLPGKEPILSFGLAGPGTGVPFHIHGPTFAETIWGRKRWFLYPPEHSPEFHPDITTLQWFMLTLPTLPPDQAPYQCTLHPGEVLYIPDRWWHATLNVDTTVFMSTFLA